MKKTKSFGEIWAELSDEQREYLRKYIDKQRQYTVEHYQMEIDKQIHLLKQALEKTTNFDDEQEKIDFILDVANEFKKLIISEHENRQ